MAKIKTLKEADGTKVYPVTIIDAVKNEAGTSLSSILSGLNSLLSSLSEGKEEALIYTQVGENITGNRSFSEIKQSYQSGVKLSARIVKNGVQVSGNLFFSTLSNNQVIFLGIGEDYTISILTHKKDNTVILSQASLPRADSKTAGIVRLGTAGVDNTIRICQGTDDIPKVSKEDLDSYIGGVLDDYLSEYIPANTVKSYASTSEPTSSDGKIGDIWVVVES